MRTRVLLLDGHTIQVLPFLKAYAALNVEVTIFCENKLSYGYFSRYNKHTVICPPIAENVIAYKTFLLDYIRKYPQDMVIPLFNDTAEFASKFKQEIEQYGCKVEIPDWEVFIKGHDKESLMEICKFLGVPHPRTANPDKMGYEEAINYVGYPCLIKPNLSAGAKGIKIIRNKADFDNYFQDITSHFGKSTIQEFIPQTGKQLKVQIYRAENGQVVASSCYEKCRYYPIDGGTSTCNKVVKRDDLVVRYSKILDYLNWVGIADFDCIEDPRSNEVLLMEINPRVPGTIKASFLAGVNIAEIMLCHVTGMPYKKYEYKTDFYMRNLATEILWFFASRERFKSKPCWFKFWGFDLFYVDGSWGDPMPMIAGVLSGIKKKWLIPILGRVKEKVD